jgi:hypothetical protein
MILVKILLIIVWALGAYFLFMILPNASVEQWLQKNYDYLLTRGKQLKSSIVQSLHNLKKDKLKKENLNVTSTQAIAEPVKEPEKEQEDEVDFSEVEIFSSSLKIRQSFYLELTPAQKQLFDELYVLDHPSHLVKSLQYNPAGDNQLFFKSVFNYLYHYRKLISLELLKVLTDEMLHLAQDNFEAQTILYEIAIRTAYFRRKDAVFFSYAQSLAELDVALNRNSLKRKNQFVYSYARLAIILEKKKLYKEALLIVEEAIQLGLKDNTVTGYQGRRLKILEKMRKES